MILTCPNCNTRFNFPKEGLGKTGVKVRCTECLEVWHQGPVEGKESSDAPLEEGAVTKITGELDEAQVAPENDTGAESGKAEEEDKPLESAEDSEDISGDKETGDDDQIEEAKPETETEEDGEGEAKGKTTSEGMENNDNSESPSRDKMPDKRVMSFGAAGALFVLSFLILLIVKTPLMNSYPSMHGFYSLFGLGMEVPGEDLIFDKITSTMTKNKLHVEGKIVNLGDQTRDVPLIEASIRDKDHHAEVIWYIVAPKEALAGEEEMHFTSIYHVKEAIDNDFKNTKDIHFRFVMKKPDLSILSEAGYEGDTKHVVEHSDDIGHGEDYPKEDSDHSKTDEAAVDNTRAHH